MRVSVTDAKGQLTELVRRAEAGDEIILTRHGHAAVRLVPLKRAPDGKARRALLEAVRISAAAKGRGGTECGVQPGLPLRGGRAAEMIAGCRLLYVGDDFVQTDVERAL